MLNMVLKIYYKSKNRTKNRCFFGQFFHENRRFFEVLQWTRTTPSSQIFFQRIRTGSSSIPDFLQRTRTDGSLILELLKEPELMVLRPWHCWKNENRRLFEKSKNRPTPVHSHPSCLPACCLRRWHGSHFERERDEREIGEFLWDQTKIAKECECGDFREREGWVFGSTLGSRKAKWP